MAPFQRSAKKPRGSAPRRERRPAPRGKPVVRGDYPEHRHEREPDGRERLQKILAAAGIGSRRQCEELISTGRVEVDGRIVSELGTRVDPVAQEIRIDGEALKRPAKVYLAVNKPSGVVTTNFDPSGRPRVIDLVDNPARLFPVGRLDLYSEGLILLTNDGELANRLTHPRYGVSKTYRVQVAGEPSDEILTRLRRGVHLAEGMARVDRVTVLHRRDKSSVLEIELSEGKNREIRRILAQVGHKVLRLMRTAVGPIRLGRLPPGGHRRLSRQEIDSLWHAVPANPGK